MLAFLLRRLITTCLTFAALTAALWYFGERLLQLTPGNPEAGKPPFTQYLDWLRDLARGNWGRLADVVHTPIGPELLNHLLPTAVLLIPAFLLQQAIAFLLGMAAVQRYRSIFDTAFTRTVFTLVAMPAFWIGLLLIEFFSVEVHWFPFNEFVRLSVAPIYGSPDFWAYLHNRPLEAWLDIAHHMVLPVTTLVLATFPADGQFIRTAMLDVMSQDYITSARARGLGERVVLWKHALRNALLPVITNIGVQTPRLLFTGAIIEYIYGLPGIGAMFCAAIVRFPDFNGFIMNRDLAVVVDFLLIFGALAIVMTIITDIVYALADPRVRV